jgi:hypothetical protein
VSQLPTSPDGLYHYFVVFEMYSTEGKSTGNAGHGGTEPFRTIADVMRCQEELSKAADATVVITGVFPLSVPVRSGDQLRYGSRPGSEPVVSHVTIPQD